jgi:hypothetical protein
LLPVVSIPTGLQQEAKQKRKGLEIQPFPYLFLLPVGLADFMEPDAKADR